MICRIKSRITPGTPKNPTIIEFKGFIAIPSPIYLPIKLKSNKVTPPIIPFTINLNIFLIGNTSIMPTIYNKKSPII